MSEDRAVYGGAGQKVNREDVVQAALTVERWCPEHYEMDVCDCPFARGEYCKIHVPRDWGLEEFLRNRGMKHEL